MSISVKGIVATPVTDVFAVVTLVRSALHAHCLSLSEHTPAERRKLANLEPKISLAPETQMAQLHFNLGRHGRTLTIFFDAVADQSHVTSQGILLSMGSDDESRIAMKIALKSLSMLGRVHYSDEFNDDGFLPMEIEPASILSQAADGDLSVFRLDALVSLFDRGIFQDLPFEKVFGISREDYERLDADLYAGKMKPEAQLSFLNGVRELLAEAQPAPMQG